jgi:Holliday junction resolvase RusA-like endonuclease
MILFELHTLPKSQKQTQYGRGTFYDPSREYKDALIWQMRSYAPKSLLEGPLSVDLMFYLPVPKGVSKVKSRLMLAGQLFPHVRPDVDNLAYVVTNAMKMVYYKDDAQIIDLAMHKRYHETPKIVVKILTIEEICH